jgi:hypothetical protein
MFIAHQLACYQLSRQVHLFIKTMQSGERGYSCASLLFCEQMLQVASTVTLRENDIIQIENYFGGMQDEKGISCRGYRM